MSWFFIADSWKVDMAGGGRWEEEGEEGRVFFSSFFFGGGEGAGGEERERGKEGNGRISSKLTPAANRTKKKGQVPPRQAAPGRGTRRQREKKQNRSFRTELSFQETRQAVHKSGQQ